MSRHKPPSIPATLLDELWAGGDAATALASGGLLDSLKKALAERALKAELSHHLEDHSQIANNCNGYGCKTMTSESGGFEIEVPRDRAGSCDPQLIGKYQRRFPGLDEKILSMVRAGHVDARDRRPSAGSL